MRLTRLLVVLALLIAPAVAQAQTQQQPPARSYDLANVLTAVALNGSADSRTFTISNPANGYSYVNLELARTRVAGTDLTMTCLSTARAGVPTASRTTCTYDASGVCTSVTATRKSATSVTETLAWTVTIHGWLRTDCTVASTAAGASDLLTVTASLVTR